MVVREEQQKAPVFGSDTDLGFIPAFSSNSFLPLLYFHIFHLCHGEINANLTQ